VFRPAWQELLPLPQPGDTLKFWKSDRWGRSAADVLATVTELRDRGVTVVSLTENFDLATKEGRLMFGVLALAAEYELELRAERQADGIGAEVAAEREVTPASPPWGVALLAVPELPARVGSRLVRGWSPAASYRRVGRIFRGMPVVSPGLLEVPGNNGGTRRSHRCRARGQVRGQSANRSRSLATSCGLSPKVTNAVSGIWSSCDAT
jgi:hypothetical protein